MKPFILTFVNQLETYKTAIKNLHWDSKNLSQHKLCDDIASAISDFQDNVAEVEQAIHGKLPLNQLKPTEYKITNLKKFVEDVISSTNSFYKKLQNEGDEYIGMRSDVESFLSVMQRQLYLVDFTIKESLKQRLRDNMNENRVIVSRGKEKYSLTENELREIVKEAIDNVTTQPNTPASYYNTAEFKRFESVMHNFRMSLVNAVNDADQFDEKRFISFAGNIIRRIDEFNSFLKTKMADMNY